MQLLMALIRWSDVACYGPMPHWWRSYGPIALQRMCLVALQLRDCSMPLQPAAEAGELMGLQPQGPERHAEPTKGCGPDETAMQGTLVEGADESEAST